MGFDTAELARRIADERERDDVNYALGGALAYAYWGPPRGTLDVDIDLFGSGSELERAFIALRRAGVELDVDEARRSIVERGDFRGWADGTRVDVFVAFDEFHDSVCARKQRRNLLGRPIWVLSAEDLTIFKIPFDRPKDWVDLERLIALQGDRFDRADVHSWLQRWIEPTDPRLVRLDQLVSRFRGI